MLFNIDCLLDAGREERDEGGVYDQHQVVQNMLSLSDIYWIQLKSGDIDTLWEG